MTRLYGRPIPTDSLNRARQARGWTVTDLAQRAHMSTETASRACRGLLVSPRTFDKIRKALEGQPVSEVARELLGMTA